MPFLQQYNYGQLAGRSPASPVAAPVMPVIHVFWRNFCWRATFAKFLL